ncbi:dihydrofolate reductase family protein [Saccharopolyspora rectivirgula]|uniref:dihydrofolate reductase family protein n=1 Tax=Saccharopolyspora rectivirgula TaxID=28042 RepID=UPI002409279C|nr:dihydrofolate reductase family protein [Saccharopolyspora rectivirgula]
MGRTPNHDRHGDGTARMELAAITLLTLDGVVQAPGGPDEDRSGNFQQGGWVAPHADEGMQRSEAEWFAAASAFLLGRRTYQIFASYWPQVTDENDPIASKLNALPKYVVSTTLERADWHNSTLIRDDPVEAVRELKDRPGGELQVHGSPTLVQFLMQHGLVDEHRLLVFPVVLGSGRRLFAEGVQPTAMRLIDTKTTENGIAIHTYRPSGPPTYGTVG